MQSGKLVLFLTIFGVASTSASTFTYANINLNGTCPQVKYITNLDLPRIAGWWYRPFSSFSSPLCYNDEGQMVYAYPTKDSEISVAACCRSAANRNLVTCAPQVGTGTLKALPTPGVFLYEFDVNVYLTFVLDTDYDNFGFMYGCKPGRHNTRDELIFIYTRDYQLAPNLETRVRITARQNNIDWSNAKEITQGPKVPYTTGPKNCQ